MTPCFGEPISWLRLERYRLRELADGEVVVVEQHLATCATCRECLAQVDAPLELPALPTRATGARRVAVSRARRRALLRWTGAAAAISTLSAAAAVMLLMSSRTPPALEPPPRRVGIKGGELAIGLVRDHAGSIANDPSRFAMGDRFKVLLTCPPSLRPHVDVVVFQDGAAFFPLPPADLSACGNAVALPGAFALDGEAPAQVCVALSESTVVDRAALRRNGLAALPAWSVCESLTAARR